MMSESLLGDEPSLESSIRRIRAGDDEERTRLLQAARPFVREVACQVCRRSLEWDEADELSVAFAAFNESIDAYDADAGASFRTFSRQVMRRRLIDYFRRESRRRELPFSPVTNGDGDDTPSLLALEMPEAQRRHHVEQLSRERAEELGELARRLDAAGLSFRDVAAASPSHAPRRQRLREAAQALAADEGLAAQVLQQGRLPRSAVQTATGMSRSAVHRGRAYLIAMVWLMWDSEFVRLRQYFQLPFMGGDDDDGA